MTKIYHLPANHGSLLDGLMQGARGLGCEASAYALGSDYAQGHGVQRSGRGRGRALLQAMRSDLVVCTYGSSLFDPPWRKHFLLDLPLYSRKAVMVFQGSDARLAYPDGIDAFRAMETPVGKTLPELTPYGKISEDERQRKRAKIAKATRHTTRLIAVNPDLLSALPGNTQYMPYPYSGRQYDVPEDSNAPLRVLHLATNRILKGTPAIEAALAKTPGIDAKVLVKVDRAEAHAALDWCDVLVDQVGLGWYGYQAVEALARGKPVLCRLDSTDWSRHVGRPPEDCGMIHVETTTIARALARLNDDPALVTRLGRAGQDFVARVHDPVTVVRDAYGDLL